MKITPEDIDRFNSKFLRKEKDECWIWQGCENGRGSGYGGLKLNGKMIRAHVFSFLVCNNITAMPEGMCVLHKCDNPSCVNPQHLWAGTHKQNMEDMSQKGRARGLRKNNKNAAKLSKEEVDFIRNISKKHLTLSHQEIAEIFKIPRRTISHIISENSWRIGK